MITIRSDAFRQLVLNAMSDVINNINNSINNLNNSINNLNNRVTQLENRVESIPQIVVGEVTTQNGVATVNINPVSQKPIVIAVSEQGFVNVGFVTDSGGRYTGVVLYTRTITRTTTSVVSGLHSSTANVVSNVGNDTGWTTSGGYIRHTHSVDRVTAVSSVTPSTTSVVNSVEITPINTVVYYMIIVR